MLNIWTANLIHLKKNKDLRKDNKVLKKQNSRMMNQVTEPTSTHIDRWKLESERSWKENLEAQSRREILSFRVLKMIEKRHGNKQN